jgi:predicted TIM-barrel enzyme
MEHSKIRFALSGGLWMAAFAVSVLCGINVLRNDVWALLAIGLAVTATVISYSAHRADRIEGAAFERGLNAGLEIRHRIDTAA